MSTSNRSLVDSSLAENVYTANKRPGFFGIFGSFFKQAGAINSLGYLFAKRNIRSRYRQSYLGFLWAFLPPVATAIVWIILYNNHIINLRDPGVPYPVFVITGTLLWSVFANAVLIPMQTVQSNRSILVKINFPRESLLVTAFYEILFNAGIAMVIVIAEMFIFKIQPDIHLLLFIPAVFLLILVGISIGLLLLPFALLYRDVQFVLPSVLQFAMYLTPVVYAKPIYDGAARILAINPVAPVLTAARSWLLGMPNEIPHWQIAAVAAGGLIFLMMGIVLYRMTLNILIERMGT